MDPSWGVLKADILGGFRVLILVFVPSEVVKPVSPSKMVLVCWWSFGVEDFHSDSVVALGVMGKFAGRAEMCFFARCRLCD